MQSLDAILETSDRHHHHGSSSNTATFEDVLASDFSLGLSVGGCSARKLPSSKSPACDDHDGRPQRQDRRPSRSSLNTISRMKKATTSKCLFDLDESNRIPTSSIASYKSLSSSMSSFRSSSSSGSSHGSSFDISGIYTAGLCNEDDYTTDESYYFGCDVDDDDESSSSAIMPMTKRHCSRTDLTLE